MMVAVVAVILAPAASVAGLYQAQQTEVGAALELTKDGRFRYQLDYGAVSEQAGGKWTSDGRTIRLTTEPKPKLPSFELLRDDSAPIGQLSIALEPPGFGEGYRLDVIATDAATGEKGLVTADNDGRVVAGGHRIAAIEPMVPVYGIVGGSIPLSPERGHRLLLRFHANDLGTAAFESEPLAITSRGLVLKRYDREIRFMRARP